MQIILIILTSTLISAFLLVSFFLGFYLGQKKNDKDKDEVMELNEQTKDKVEQMLNFINFNGDKKWK